MSRSVVATSIAIACGATSVAFAQDALPAPAQDAPPAPTQDAPAAAPSLPANAMSGLAPSSEDEPVDIGAGKVPPDMGDQAIGPMLGVAAGGRTTPGGIYVAGHYLYRLSDTDWFDGTVSFVLGGGDAECFRDRMDAVICDHGVADGYGAGLTASVRRFLPKVSTDAFWPFARAGVGTGIVRFSDDATTGITFSVHAGAGLRVSIDDSIAVVAIADFQVGLGQFSAGVGGEPQVGVNLSAGAEFRL